MKIVILWVCTCTAFSEGFMFHKQTGHGFDEIIQETLNSHGRNGADESDVQANKFTQKLDHFNPTDQTVWYQNYWQYDKFSIKNGPIFLIIDGECPARRRLLTHTSWFSHIVKYKALAFLLEHRFYGGSKPYGNLRSICNLTHLNSQQALADTAYFIEAMNKKHKFPASTKWIVFGRSYAGTLAAWMRIKYPHLVYASYAASAPLFAKANFPEYFQVVTNTLKSYKRECVIAITDANRKLDKMFRTKKGRKKIQKIFNLCDELNGKRNISAFFSTFADEFANAVQYNHPTYYPQVKALCDIMVNSSEPLMKRYGKVIHSNSTHCIRVGYKYMVESFNNTSDESGRAWYYQTCTEFGWYQTSSKRTDPFSRHLSLPFFTAFCRDVYGSKFDVKLLNNGIDRTNMFFGGVNVKIGRILFIHGSADPWHPPGIYKSSSNELYSVVFIKGTSHCADVYMASKDDSSEMKKARTEIDLVMKSWLS